MAEHFPDEEATIVPAMEHVLTPSASGQRWKAAARKRPSDHRLTQLFHQPAAVAHFAVDVIDAGAHIREAPIISRNQN